MLPRDEIAAATATTTEICDDCRKEYKGPPYYTFDIDACQVTDVYETIINEAVGDPEPDAITSHGDECTGSICPNCADGLEPDDPNDPRRPEAERRAVRWA